MRRKGSQSQYSAPPQCPFHPRNVKGTEVGTLGPLLARVVTLPLVMFMQVKYDESAM